MPRDQVFISYSHSDQKWLERLHTQLKPTIRSGAIDVWDDRRIKAGARWQDEIAGALARARVAILLVTPDFLASDFVVERELPTILNAARAEGLVVLWVAVKASAFRETEIAAYQAVNDPARPLSKMHHAHVDEELVRICARVKEAFGQSARVAGPTPVRAPTAPAAPPAPALALAPQPAQPASTSTAFHADYELLATIHDGRYSQVQKCRNRETGEVVVLKKTVASMVSVAALEALREIGHPRIVAPRRLWTDAGAVFEELPYIGGTRLSQTIPHGFGGLTGAVLDSFCKAMDDVLSRIHAAGVVHRDVHPDNIYLVASPRPDTAADFPRDRFEAHLSISGAPRCQLSWYLVDNTFAIHGRDASKFPPVLHGNFTAPEQAHGRPEAASDRYALAATLIYGITGCEIPSYASRAGAPNNPIRPIPRGGHPSHRFGDFLSRSLALEPSLRPATTRDLSPDTVGFAFTGTLEIGEDHLLLVNTFQDVCLLVEKRAALPAFASRPAEDDPNWGWEEKRVAAANRYWACRLRGEPAPAPPPPLW